MIAIINTTETKNGNHVYRLQINNKLITTFEHRREEGLAACLRRAADAAQAQEVNDLVNALADWQRK